VVPMKGTTTLINQPIPLGGMTKARVIAKAANGDERCFDSVWAA
jgi:hypothetical protein